MLSYTLGSDGNYLQPRHTLKIAPVRRGNSHALAEGGGGNPKIMGTDQIAIVLELGPNFCVDSSNCHRDRQGLERREKALDEGGAARAGCDALGAVDAVEELTRGDHAYRAIVIAEARAEGARPAKSFAVIAAVTFDFWNTIAQVPEGAMPEARRRAVAAACNEGGLAVEPALLEASLEEVRLRWESSWAEGVHLHPREGAEMLLRALAIEDEGGTRVAAAFLGAINEVELELAAGIRRALQELGARGIRIGIVCDVGFSGGAMLRNLLGREGLLGHFDGWSFSDETGHYKPAREAFVPALAALGAQPQEALHVGDLRRTDIAGAAALGMRTARYRGMHDDPDESGVEADFVLDSHLELVEVVDRLRR